MMTEVSSPRLRAARTAWARDHMPDGDPDDPTQLAEWLLHQRAAARSISSRRPAGEVDALRVYWRDRVATELAAYE